jgi:hypothetical protein
MGDAELVSSWRSQLGYSQALGLQRGSQLHAMELFMPYPYTSVSSGSTFGLLHPCRNSSIVSISASTLVLSIGHGAEVDTTCRILGRNSGVLSIDLECASV